MLINDGGGGFHRDHVYTSAAIDDASVIAAGDVGGNGIVDVVVVGRVTRDLAVLLGTGGGQLAAPRGVADRGARDLAVGDFNSDGRLDAALAAYPDPATVRLGTGDGTFGPARRFGAADGGALAVTSADLNHDGTLDLAVGLEGGRVGVLLGNGDGTFAAQREYAMRYPADAVLIADLDGDGIADIATSGFTTAPFIVRLGRGDGTFQTRHSLPSFDAYSDALLSFVEEEAVADFNVDGRSDIAVLTGQGDISISKTSVLLNWTHLSAPPCVVVRSPARECGAPSATCRTPAASCGMCATKTRERCGKIGSSHSGRGTERCSSPTLASTWS